MTVKRYFIIIISLLTVLAGLRFVTATEPELPFASGEKMTFQVRWEFILAGEAVLEVLPIESLNGLDVRHFVFTARTNEFVDLFYKVRDRVDSYVSMDMNGSHLYRQRKQGKSEKDVVVHFDREKHTVQYSDFGESLEPLKIEPGSFDPLSVFFAFRLYDPELQKEIHIPLSDGKKSITGKAMVKKRENIEVSGISYDTFLVEPDLEHIGGVFQKSPGARLQIWITADTRRIPVRIKSKVAVGSFVAELVSYEAGK